jgi:hypothetical protein
MQPFIVEQATERLQNERNESSGTPVNHAAPLLAKMVDPATVTLTLLGKVGGAALKGAGTVNTLWSLHDKIKTLCDTMKKDNPEESKKQILVELNKAEAELGSLKVELESELNVLKDALDINHDSLVTAQAHWSALQEELERAKQDHERALDRALGRAKQDNERALGRALGRAKQDNERALDRAKQDNERALDRALDRAKQDRVEEIDRNTCLLVQAHQDELARVKKAYLEQLASVKQARDGHLHRFRVRVRAFNRPAAYTPDSSNIFQQGDEEVFA